MQLCDAFDLPILFLCDTPGIMVGPEVEKTALVRHAARMFVAGASLTVPFFTIVLRKGYGLGAQAMAGGSFKAPLFTVAWPTGEFGGMGLEGAVKLGFRKELAAIDDPAERRALFEEMVARMYEHGKAVNMRHALRDRRRDRPGRVARAGSSTRSRSAPPPPPRDGQEAAVRRHVVSGEQPPWKNFTRPSRYQLLLASLLLLFLILSFTSEQIDLQLGRNGRLRRRAPLEPARGRDRESSAAADGGARRGDDAPVPGITTPGGS